MVSFDMVPFFLPVRVGVRVARVPVRARSCATLASNLARLRYCFLILGNMNIFCSRKQG